MNQKIKDLIYTKGTQQQINFMAELGGMNEEEKTIFQLFHEGRSDEYIQDTLNISRSAFEKVSMSVRTKLIIAVFDCINYRMYIK